jgi:hypothetical protein
MKQFEKFKHEPKVCPACQVIFECRAGNIEQCQCRTVKLELAVQQRIEDTYTDCLCVDCLRKIRKEHFIVAFYDRIKKLFGMKKS